jgi:hypothetical protein
MRLEDNLQIACINWFKYQYPKILITSFPAGYVFAGTQQQRQRTGKRMSQMGYCNGIPDLFIIHPNNRFHGLFVELKTEKGIVSKEQKEMLEKLSKLNFAINICRSIESFMACVKLYMKYETNQSTL